MPYVGSKTRYARRIVDLLPASHTFVDLFAGGGAMTHAAMISGKYDIYIYIMISILILYQQLN